MNPSEEAFRQRAAGVFVGAAAIAPLLSTAAANVLLALAVIAAVVFCRVRIPRIWAPAALFLAATLLSLAASPDPGAGLPQVKKFYVFLIAMAVYTAVRKRQAIERLLVGWLAAATASALWSFVEFWRVWSSAARLGRPFYTHYIADRITGFMSHWMTLAGELMIVLLTAFALLCMAGLKLRPGGRVLAWAAMAIISTSLVLSLTRGVWIATAAGMLFLIAHWRPKMLLAAPLVLALGWLAAPEAVRERLTSIYRPQARDSNEHRRITFRTAIEMMKAHPWLGVGPQLVGREFDRYVPADIARPLPDGYYQHLHSIYLHFAAERGLLALIAIVWLLAMPFVTFYRAARGAQDSFARAILLGSCAVIIGIAIEGFVELNLGDSEVLSMFLTSVSLGYSVLRLEPANV